jgi:hypothetical protein
MILEPPSESPLIPTEGDVARVAGTSRATSHLAKHATAAEGGILSNRR